MTSAPVHHDMHRTSSRRRYESRRLDRRLRAGDPQTYDQATILDFRISISAGGPEGLLGCQGILGDGDEEVARTHARRWSVLGQYRAEPTNPGVTASVRGITLGFP